MPPMWYCKPCTAATGNTTAVHHPADEPCPNDAMSVSYADQED